MWPPRATSIALLRLLNCSYLHLLSSCEAARGAPRMLSIGGLEQLVGPPPTHLRDAGYHRGKPTRREEQLRGADLDRVGHRHGRQRRARSDRRLGLAVEADERVARRCAEIDHDVRFVLEPPVPAGLWLARLR